MPTLHPLKVAQLKQARNSRTYDVSDELSNLSSFLGGKSSAARVLHDRNLDSTRMFSVSISPSAPLFSNMTASCWPSRTIRWAFESIV